MGWFKQFIFGDRTNRPGRVRTTLTQHMDTTFSTFASMRTSPMFRIGTGSRRSKSGNITMYERTYQTSPGGWIKRTYKTLNPKSAIPKVRPFKNSNKMRFGGTKPRAFKNSNRIRFKSY